MRKKSFESIEFYIQHGIDVEKRRITLDEEVDEYSIGWAFRGMQIMLDKSEDPIDIYISSFGGSVYDGLSLIGFIRRCPALVRTHAMGKIMSMAFLIYLAGHERYSDEFSTFMNHSISSMAWGKLHEMETEVNECKRLEELSLGLLEEYTFKDKKWWKRQSKYEDKYFDKTKAVELGIVINEY